MSHSSHNITNEQETYPVKVDSARAYRNEGPCSDAIKKSGLPRSEIFFTSKVPPRSIGYEQTKASINSTFEQTGLDYIDLYIFPPCHFCKSDANTHQVFDPCSVWRAGSSERLLESSCRSPARRQNQILGRVQLRRSSP